MTRNEIDFCKLMEQTILPNRNKGVSYDDIKKAANLIGYQMNGTCNTCYRNYGVDLINIYGGMEPQYIDYKNSIVRQKERRR